MNIEKSQQKIKEEEKMKAILKAEKEAEKLIENRTFTPVTKESFESFFKIFYEKNCKKSKLKIEQESRITGREFFMLAKSKVGIENETEDDDDNIPEETLPEKKNKELVFDEDAFNDDDNLDEINFDDEDDN